MQLRKPSASFVICVLAGLHGCGSSPPVHTTDEDDAQVYTDVADRVRRELNLTGRLYLHPYLAVATDSAGMPRADLTTFEFERAAALELMQQQDSTVVICQHNARGMCAEDYLVFSQIVRVGERDAVVIVRSQRASANGPVLVVRLRYGRAGWSVSGSELVT